MIRRVFWLSLGAAGGIMGYRRVVRLSRRSLARDTIRAAREVRSFSQDVRDGMELYSARRPQAIASTLPESPASINRGAGQRRPPSKKDDR